MGTWNYNSGPVPLRNCLDAGALFIDTSESYGTESVVAEAVAGRRDQVFLATKISPGHFRRNDVIRAADESLRRLRSGHLDLYQLHEPNETIPVEETLGAVEELIDAGKVRFAGVSNFSVTQLKRAQRAMRRHPVVANQVRFSLIDRTISPDLLPYCQTNGITVIAYSPLARGLHHILDCDPQGVLMELAKAINRTPLQIALNWCLYQDRVAVIPKGNSDDHIVENCGASDWRLSPEQFRRLDESVVFRFRGRVDSFIRKCLPSGLKQGLKQFGRMMPACLRRRLH
ncbi:MAG: aldo/keto reductase [Opitutaceae bacterium]|nr:aldo/keto reductase [Verrucomicrobiales bacterium]